MEGIHIIHFFRPAVTWKKIALVLVLKCASHWPVQAQNAVQNANEVGSTNVAFWADKKLIEIAATNRDATVLIATAKSVEARWSSTESIEYLRLMHRLTSAFLTSELFSFDERDRRGYEYLEKGLARTNIVAPLAKMNLLMYMRPVSVAEVDGKGPEEWLAFRSGQATRWLRVWQEAEAAVDRAFDVSNRDNAGMMNIQPPTNAITRSGVVTSGMAPSAILNADARAEYEEALARNKAKGEKYGYQRQLLYVLTRFKVRARERLAALYLLPPAKPDELRTLVNHYLANLPDEGEKKAILQAAQAEK